jgi:Domain of unknown function (DUF222)/HNH endonuclease
MDSNTHSTQDPTGPAGDLADLTALLDRMAARDLERLPDTIRAERVQGLRPLVHRLEGQWLKELAGLDARGAAGAEQGVQFGSTASWLRARSRMTRGAATTAVRTARALFRGPLPESGKALCQGEISVAHAEVLAASTLHLPDHAIQAAEATLLDSARCQDPTRLRQVVTHTEYVIDPDGADGRAQRRYERRGVWFTVTYDRMVVVRGIMDPEAGQIVQAALDPLARPADAADTRSGGQRTADALTELARRQLEAGQLPKSGGVRLQLSVIVDLPSLHRRDRLEGLEGGVGRLGGEMGGAGPLEPEACRRLACDASVTRVVVSRQPLESCDRCHGRDPYDPTASAPQGWLRAVLAKLPPILGGAPSRPLNLGRSTRVVSPAQRQALAVRDGGCVFPGCSRPLAWCEGHHVWHWLDGGPTDLDNLALVCRAHHRAVHEGGWRLIRGPDGQFTATPPYRKHQAA